MNFDYLRLFLASVVMTGHINLLQGEFSRVIDGDIAVKSFFCISGFLITESFVRSKDLQDFFLKRFKRIYPPIVVVVILMMAFGFATEKALTWKMSLMGLLIFQDWAPAVKLAEQNVYYHGAFWTLVVELQFYLILPAILIILKRNRYLGIAILALLYFSSVELERLWATTRNEGGLIRQNFFVFSRFFIAGMAASLWILPSLKDEKLLQTALALCCALLLWKYYLYQPSRISWLYPLVLVGIILTLANLFGLISRKAFFGDLSYGIYIYHYPVMSILEAMDLGQPRNVIIITTTLSFLSWHLLEKKLLTNSKIISEQRQEPAFTFLNYIAIPEFLRRR